MADLIAPDLTYLVNLGYGTGPANVPTPAGLFPTVDPSSVLANLEADSMQGVNNALADLTQPQTSSAELSQLLALPSSILAELPNGLADQIGSTDLLGSAGSDAGTLLSDMSGPIGSQVATLADPMSFMSILGLYG